MAKVILLTGGAGGGMSDDCTALAANVLEGYTAVTADSDDEVIVGTMPNRSGWLGSMPFNGTVTIPDGFHDGTTKIVQSEIPIIPETIYTPSTTDQYIEMDQWVGGDITIRGDASLVAGNIKNGVTIFGVTGNYLRTATLTPSTTTVNIYKINGSFTYTYDGDGTVTPTSSNTGACTVSHNPSTKTVTINFVGAGSSTITLTASQGSVYAATTAKVTVNAYNYYNDATNGYDMYRLGQNPSGIWFSDISRMSGSSQSNHYLLSSGENPNQSGGWSISQFHFPAISRNRTIYIECYFNSGGSTAASENKAVQVATNYRKNSDGDVYLNASDQVATTIYSNGTGSSNKCSIKEVYQGSTKRECYYGFSFPAAANTNTIYVCAKYFYQMVIARIYYK